MVRTGDADDAALQAYFTDIAQSEPLSRQREVELAARIRQGDLEARDELVQANLRFVVEIALQFRHRELSLAELVSAGNVGLLTAADRFDGTRGFKFISYAVWWIRQAILQALDEQTRVVRLPASQLSLLRQIAEASRGSDEDAGTGTRIEDVAEKLGLTVKEVLDVTGRARFAISLDVDTTLPVAGWRQQLLVDETQRSPDADLVQQDMRASIDALVGRLAEREQLIIRRFFGLDGEGPRTLDMIGQSLGVTRERARQLKMRALVRLRHSALRDRVSRG